MMLKLGDNSFSFVNSQKCLNIIPWKFASITKAVCVALVGRLASLISQTKAFRHTVEYALPHYFVVRLPLISNRRLCGSFSYILPILPCDPDANANESRSLYSLVDQSPTLLLFSFAPSFSLQSLPYQLFVVLRLRVPRQTQLRLRQDLCWVLGG